MYSYENIFIFGSWLFLLWNTLLSQNCWTKYTTHLQCFTPVKKKIEKKERMKISWISILLNMIKYKFQFYFHHLRIFYLNAENKIVLWLLIRKKLYRFDRLYDNKNDCDCMRAKSVDICTNKVQWYLNRECMQKANRHRN